MITLAVQASGIAIIATGMVMVIVSRNIDLSVGSVVGVIAMSYALLMTDWFPNILGIRPDTPFVWALALAIGIGIGAAIGALQGFIIAYIGVPSFIVTLGGLLTIRGLIWYQSQGAAVNGLDSTFLLIGGGAQGSIGEVLTWGLALVGCLAIVALLINGRRQRRRYGFPVRPMWAEIALAVVGCVAVLGIVVVREQQLLAAGPRQPGRPGARLGAGARGRLADPDRVPVSDRPGHRRHARDDLDRHPSAVRAVRLRLRRQSRRRRAGRHQHPSGRSSRPTS